MTRSARALVLGMDFYEDLDPLPSAREDAKAIAELLRVHHDGSHNFEVDIQISEEYDPLTGEKILSALDTFFTDSADADLVLYFSGHAQSTAFGLQLATADKSGSFDVGIPFESILHRANRGEHGFLTIILDCCFAGGAGNAAIDARFDMALIRENVTILASSRGDKESFYEELSDYTRVLIDGLQGAAANAMGQVTPFGLHELTASHPLLSRNGWPVIKAHASSDFVLRCAAPPLDASMLALDFELFDDAGRISVKTFRDAAARMRSRGWLVEDSAGDTAELSALGKYWQRRANAGRS